MSERDKKRERLWAEYVRPDMGSAHSLLSIVEASELKAAEEARASAIEECAKIVRAVGDEMRVGGGIPFGPTECARRILELRAAPPSPEPERATEAEQHGLDMTHPLAQARCLCGYTGNGNVESLIWHVTQAGKAASEPEPEPLFPNERFEAQSGSPQPVVYDWTPKPREPEALTERGFRQIGEAHNALVTRVEALEITVRGMTTG